METIEIRMSDVLIAGLVALTGLTFAALSMI